jgi:hypothetical protein
MIKRDGLKDPFTGKPAVNFLDKDSFIQKLHLHAQEFQMVVIIVQEFFIKHVKHHNGNVEFWVKEIFQSCLQHKDLVRMYNNIFSLFPNGNDPKLAKELLENPDAMRDQVSRKANDINFKVCYSKLVETALKTIKQKTRSDKKPSAANHVLLARARARARNWGKKAEPPVMGYLIPSTTIQDVQSPETNEISLVRSSVACNFLLHLLLYLSCHGCLMPSFSLSCFIGADSLVPAGPVNVKRLTSEPTEETRVDLNALLPTLANQLA